MHGRVGATARDVNADLKAAQMLEDMETFETVGMMLEVKRVEIDETRLFA